MSVLNFPRIYLNGQMFWNPPTANNNDMFPLYDAVNTDINWSFMTHFGIDRNNAPDTLMPWAISTQYMAGMPTYVQQVPNNINPKHDPYMPAEWDLFGDNGCGLVNYGKTKSTVIGGEVQPNSYIDKDALIGAQYHLLGSPLGSNTPTAARFVDISPWQNTFTALYFDKLVLGDANCGLTLNRKYRMMDRFLNFSWGALGGLVNVSTTWQTCFPKENLEWALGNSSLLANLKQQMEQQGAQGLMFRFCVYLTCYDKNGIFNDYPQRLDTRSNNPNVMAKVRDLYRKGLDNVNEIFFNPAYSRTSAVLGLWFAGEYPTAPAGRRLVANEAVSMSQLYSQETQQVKLGVISAQINDYTLSLDLGNTFPSYPVDATADIPVPEKFNAGTYHLGAEKDGTFKPAVILNFADYRQSAFNQRSGILDVPLDDYTKGVLESGPLILRRLGLYSAPQTVAATQQTWTAEVIESGSFIDVGDYKKLTIMVQNNGQPAANTTLWVAEYNNPYMVTSSDYYLAFSNAADFTLFYDNPADRSKNTAGLPQFTDAPSVGLYRSTGSGRRLTDLQDVPEPSGTPVGYQEFLTVSGKPVAVNLRPCLTLDKPIGRTGTLNDEKGNSVNYTYAVITTNAQGIAQIGCKAVAPGFPTLRFFVKEGDKDPTIPFSFPLTEAYVDFLAPLRVLPLDMKLQQDFIDTWNGMCTSTQAPEEIWNTFIFPKVLQSFYYLYPIMNKYMPLDSRTRVEGAVDQLLILINKDNQDESTLAMPITRDLSQSRRAVLQLWAKRLVKLNFPPRKLSMSDYNDL
ncbi:MULTISPECIES: hypothetical protein [Pseudomonas]|uniref:Uncharacterized protein n=1 Tax=Pseudomonas cucumis TaxID=2954082 RepID=A0ABY9EQD8_9PSED|nr:MULTISPECIES: hypothetical protein [Pseudomonas]MDR8367060.1 hypothetical protein [Pseudomonas sp. JL3]URM25987.1 hypothetical protein LLY42_18685 [Pseudomonas frederiksbergensis]WLG82544.1 hypothetical protein PSH97_15510 [Pseudomonas cucumis]